MHNALSCSIICLHSKVHNTYIMQPQDKYATLLQICKENSLGIVNSAGNLPHGGRQPRCSDLELIALSLLQESLNMSSERYFFSYLSTSLPSLAMQVGTLRNYNIRRRRLSAYVEEVRLRVVKHLNAYFGNEILVVDSMPLPSCMLSRSKRCRIFAEEEKASPDIGFCAAQQMYYFGHKLHCVCSAAGIIQAYDLSKASVHDIHYLHDIVALFANCVLIGDKGYHDKQRRMELFEFFGIELATPCRKNELLQYTMPEDYMRIRKRIEVIFSQLVDQLSIRKNYAKSQSGLFTRVIAKVTLFTFLQYINMKEERELNRIRYSLAA